MKNAFEQIKDLRDEIDILDEKLLVLLARRAKIVQKIGGIKRGHSLKLFDEKRWKKVVCLRLSKSKSLGLPSVYVKQLFKVIHEFSLKLQKHQQL